MDLSKQNLKNTNNKASKLMQSMNLTCGKAGAALYIIVSAFLVIMLASRSSFLYPCNDWNDANSYFSVGKALFNGKMPYRDVFDQKGMILYFLYGLAYQISHTTFIGVFVLEVILAAFSLCAIYHILQLYMREKTALVLSVPVLAVTVSSFSFYWGGSAEEICFPFLIWGFYLILKYFHIDYPDQPMSMSTLLWGGILAGVVANIKFTGLGFFFAWMMWVAFSFLVRKDILGALKACLIFLAGMAIPFLPWVIYFGVNNGLKEWYYGYVYINVFVYSNLKGEGPGITERIYTLAKLLYWLIRQNFCYFLFIIPGMLWSIFGKREKSEGKKTGYLMERLLTPVLAFFLFIGIYIGGSVLPYYALPLAVFTVLGFCFLGQCYEKLTVKFEKQVEKLCFRALRIVGPGVVLLLSLGFIWITSMNISFMRIKKEDIFLYKFRDIISEEQAAGADTHESTLLNIGCLDAGLYTVCDIVPTCRWFQTQTLPIDDVQKEQERYIKEGQIDYVLARDSYPEVIWEVYELVGKEKWYQGEQEFTYYLFHRKGNV